MYKLFYISNLICIIFKFFIFFLFSNKNIKMTSQINDNIKMIQNELNLITKSLNQYEIERAKTMIYPYYDGGLIQIILYYVRKYKLPIELKDEIKNINKNDNNNKNTNNTNNTNNNTLLNICQKSYDNKNKPDLISSVYNDLFIEQYLNNYYFLNKPYDFNTIMEELRSNSNGSETSSSSLRPILLGLIALNEKPTLGGINKNKLNGYIIFVNKLAIKIIRNLDKQNISSEYYIVAWLYQLLNSSMIADAQELYYNIVYNLLNKYSNNNNELLTIDSYNSSNNYFHNWICYALIQDYFSNQDNTVYFHQKFLKESSSIKKLTIESFSNDNTEKKEKNKKDNKHKKGKKGKKDKDKKDKKGEKEKPSLIKFIMYCIIFAVLLLVGTFCIINFWSFMLKKFLQSK